MPAEENTAPAVFPPAVLENASQAVSTVAALADIPEEDIWLAKQKSKRTRRAYKQDVRHFMRTLTIRSYEELRKVDHPTRRLWKDYGTGPSWRWGCRWGFAAPRLHR